MPAEDSEREAVGFAGSSTPEELEETILWHLALSRGTI
jgi:hypothetical protein